MGNTYPVGASVEVRIRAEATNSSGNYIYGPWSNIRTVTYKNGASNALKALTITGAPVTVEAGSSASYTVALTKAYAGTLSITSSATAKATVDPATLTFSTTNYSTGQTVMVTGVEAGTATINHAFRLTGAAADAIPDAGTVAVTVSAATPVPAAPTGLSATAGNGQVVLSWSDPDNDSITSYEVRYGKVGESWGAWTAISGSDAETIGHTVASLDNGSEYRFRIRAVNSAGNGAQSAVVRATPVVPATAGVTLSATSLTVEEGSSNTYTVKLDKAPTADVTITVSGASGDVTVDGSPLTFTPSNFSATQTITVNAAADEDTTDDTATLTHAASSSDTDYGASLEIDDVDVTVTDTTPTLQLSTDPAAVTEGTDIRLTVTSDQALTGNLTVSLTLAARSSSTFTAADIAGTLGPRNFTAAFGNSPSATGAVTIPTSTDTVVESAEAYRITLNDAAGYAIGSDVIADGTLNDGTTATPVPAAPTSLSASGAGTTQVLLTWTKPAGTITGYKLRYAKTPAKGSATWAAMAGSGANTVRHMVTGLEDDAEYSFMIRAVNASGDGAATGWVTATPMDSCPSVLSPTNLSLAARSDGFVVTWTAPTDVFRNGWTLSYGKTGESSTSVTISNAAATSRTLTGLDANTEYEISLTATHSTYNPSAVCPPGLTVKATGTTGATVAKPAAPTGLSATAGNGQVVLSWSDPDNDSITRYEVRYGKVGESLGAWTAISNSDAETTGHTVTSLDNGSEYRFRIRAVNSAGNGVQSAVVRATPVVPATAGVTLSATSLTVEEGSSNTYTVKLDKAPSADVTITVSGASGDVTVDGSPLTFTPSNFSATQTITVNAAADEDTTDDTATLTHAASSSDTDYGASLEIDDVDVTVTDTTPTLQLSTDPAAVTEGTAINLTVTSDQALTGKPHGQSDAGGAQFKHIYGR